MHVMVEALLEALLVMSMSSVSRQNLKKDLCESGGGQFDQHVFKSGCDKPVNESSVHIDEGRTFC